MELHNSFSDIFTRYIIRLQHRKQLKVNWKLHEEIHSQDCSSLSELSQCDNSCNANFHASIGEIFLPITWVNLRESEAERMFISRRLHMVGDNNLVDDLITSGCEVCGIPVNGYGLGFYFILFYFFALLDWIIVFLFLAGQVWSKIQSLYTAKEAQIIYM